MDNQKPDISPHLAEYYYILSKHKWIIIGSLIIMVTLTMFFTFRMKAVYRATATLVIDKEQSQSPLTGERIDFESYVSQSLTFNTHFKLITSRQVLEEVIRRLKLDRRDDDIEVSPWKRLLAQVKENIRLLLDQEEESLTPEAALTKTVEALLENLDIQEVRDTRLLKISVEDHDPSMAMETVNSLANAYIEFNIGNRLKSSKNTLSWMRDQLYEMKKKLEDSEEAFLAYKQRENLFSVEGKQLSIAQKIADFNDAQLEARNKRLEVNAKLQQLKLSLASGVGHMDVRSLISNPRIDNLNTQLLDTEVELSRLGKVYKSKHPKIVQIKTKIDKTKKKLIQEVQKELKSLEAEGAVLLAREKAMEKTIADFDQEALSTNRKELKYSILQRSVTTNQKLYDTLLSKVEESNVVKDADVSNIRIVERAVLPLSPVKPKKKRNLALSIIFGLMTGVGLAFLLEYMDRSLRTEEDVQRYMDLPVLSVVPEADKGKSTAYGAQDGGRRTDVGGRRSEDGRRKSENRCRRTEKMEHEKPATPEPLNPKRPSPMKSKAKAQKLKARRTSMAFLENYPANSRFAEAFRTLRTNIQFSFLDKEFRVILVTSAGQAEGKTTITMNLAHTMARAGKSVLMMDADLRKPTLSHLAVSHKSRGLTGLISELFGTDVGEGRLGDLGVSDLIRLLTLQKKSGRLHLDDDKDVVEVRFARGGIKGVNWLTRPDEKKLAAILGKGGLITTDQAAQAILRQKDTGQKLGFIIINMGMLTEDKLKGPLTIHMIEGLRAALQMKSGKFRFEEFQETESEHASFDPVDFDQVYTRALIGNEEIPFLHKGIDEAIVKTNTDNLSLLPAGRIAPNPSEVMGSNRMSFLITHLKDRFDRVIIDTPPILPASDALVLTPRTDGVVLVVKAGLMNRELVKNTVDQLKLAQANLLGIVLNRVDLKREGYYKYYHKYYSKYYGEEADNR